MTYSITPPVPSPRSSTRIGLAALAACGLAFGLLGGCGELHTQRPILEHHAAVILPADANATAKVDGRPTPIVDALADGT